MLGHCQVPHAPLEHSQAFPQGGFAHLVESEPGHHVDHFDRGSPTGVNIFAELVGERH
jgi:hypothetical protein